jgi:hypothetical protein
MKIVIVGGSGPSQAESTASPFRSHLRSNSGDV